MDALTCKNSLNFVYEFCFFTTQNKIIKTHDKVEQQNCQLTKRVHKCILIYAVSYVKIILML